MSVGQLLRNELDVLGDEERERIWAEEMLRAQARQEAERRFVPAKSRWEKSRAFLNSAFGLWLLSTCVIGFGTYQFKQIQERSARRTEADRLEIEIRHRLTLFHKNVNNLAREVLETQEAGNDPWGMKFASRLRDGYRYIQTAESAFFSNFSHDNVQALFTSLQDKLKTVDPKKASVIDDCLERMKIIRKRCEDDYNDVPRPDSAKMHEAYYAQVQWMIEEVLQCLRSQPLNLWALNEIK